MKKFILILIVTLGLGIIAKSQTSAGLVDQVADFTGSCQPGQTGYASGTGTLWVCHNTGNFIGNTPVLQWVKVSTGGGGGTPGGVTTQLQFNNANSFGGTSNATYNLGTGQTLFTSQTGTTTPALSSTDNDNVAANPYTPNVKFDSPSGSHRCTISVGIEAINQLNICWQTGDNGQIIIGSAITPANLQVIPFPKLVVESATGPHTVGYFLQNNTSATGDEVVIGNGTAAGTGWNAISAWSGVNTTSGIWNTGTKLFGVRGDGLVTAVIFNPSTGFQIGGAATNNHCLVGNGTNYVDAVCPAGAPAGSSGAIQGNTSSAFAAIPGFTYATASGALTAQPTSDAVPMSVKCFASGTSDCFQIYNNAGVKSAWITANGNFNTLGSNATYQDTVSNTAAWLWLYGGSSPANAGAYLHASASDGTHNTYLYFDPTVAGTASLETTVITGISTAGNRICTPTNALCATASGVTSFSGDGALLSNSSSTGVVTATLGSAAAYSVWGNTTNASATPSYTSNPNVNSVVLQGATSGSTTLSVTATAGTLNIGSTNVTATSAGIVSAVGFNAGNTGSFEGKTTTQAVVFQGGQDVGANSAVGGATLRGGDQTAAGGAGASGGNILERGGNNAATNVSSRAGSVEIIAGQSTGATQGIQGLLSEAGSEVKGATVTQWNLECPSSTTAMTVADCGASPGNWMGIAETVNTNTVVYIFHGYTLVNASAAVTIGDTVCAGTTAGQVTDSGGTTACAIGSQVGIVRATSGTFQLGDGTSITPTTTKPLVLIARD